MCNMYIMTIIYLSPFQFGNFGPCGMNLNDKSVSSWVLESSEGSLKPLLEVFEANYSYGIACNPPQRPLIEASGNP